MTSDNQTVTCRRGGSRFPAHTTGDQSHFMYAFRRCTDSSVSFHEHVEKPPKAKPTILAFGPNSDELSSTGGKVPVRRLGCNRRVLTGGAVNHSRQNLVGHAGLGVGMRRPTALDWVKVGLKGRTFVSRMTKSRKAQSSGPRRRGPKPSNPLQWQGRQWQGRRRVGGYSCFWRWQLTPMPFHRAQLSPGNSLSQCPGLICRGGPC